MADKPKINNKTKKKIKKEAKKFFNRNKLLVIIIVIALLVTLTTVYIVKPQLFIDGYEFVVNLFNGDTTPPDTVPNKNIGDLVVHFIDVGQGDCIYIEFPDNSTMLIDGADNGSEDWAKVKTYLDSLQVTFIDIVMLSHTDADHVGSLDKVVENYEVGMFYVPKLTGSHGLEDAATIMGTISTKVYTDFYNFMIEEQFTKDGTLVDSVINYNIGAVTIKNTDALRMIAYCPEESYYTDFNYKDGNKNIKGGKAQDVNNQSPIAILEYAGRKICFTGDADELAEDRFIEMTGNKVDVDILKVGHHGGKDSSNQQFLDHITPEYSVISVGEGNSYGHPTEETLGRLQAMNNQIYRTDIHGNIKLVVSGEGAINFTMDNAA